MKQAAYQYIDESDRDILYPIYEDQTICSSLM